MPRVLDLVRSSLRRLKCWGKYLSPDDVRLLLASRRVLSDIEPHLNNIADRQAALLHNSAEYTFAELWRRAACRSAIFFRRSEENTSEIHSPMEIVCRPLRAKIKKTN